MEGFAQSALRKEQLIPPFVERFNTLVHLRNLRKFPIISDLDFAFHALFCKIWP